MPHGERTRHRVETLLPEDLAPQERRLDGGAVGWGQVRVTLTDGSEGLLAQRTLTTVGTCAQQARLLAALAAAWLGELAEEPLPKESAEAHSLLPTWPSTLVRKRRSRLTWEGEGLRACVELAAQLWPLDFVARFSDAAPPPAILLLALGVQFGGA